MGALLICDVPGCDKTTPAISRAGRVSAPDGWSMQVNVKAAVVVGCCDEHFLVAAARASGK